MALLTVIRHAQASFGAANYDKLSELGLRQSVALGRALKAQGAIWPERVFVGEQVRHRETFEGVAEGFGASATPIVHPGLNEFDFKALLEAHKKADAIPERTTDNRAAHFRQLKATVLAWQADEIENPPERFDAFVARVQDAMEAAHGPGDVWMFSSGGAVSQMIRLALGAPAEQQILLQLQMKNCAVNRFVIGRGGTYLHGFNETPHVDADTAGEMLTYS
ncbi:histidine phosphatase family protein [Maritimibacter sp. DP1N21-5]|uniref:histidine phosphatase family protein n=1 Tax=Maritimibacter sp. DP1N21-5 TaxID=2836867 RepID=UPI001C454D2B|nr:histidine phosphatase family protein [Maritimibacter sp. DP1N21-5]MBV7407654.1 histidine phosphatase family protein [Maritimibacter sp. DP1N21-5]